jgi:hypothetical protein
MPIGAHNQVFSGESQSIGLLGFIGKGGIELLLLYLDHVKWQCGNDSAIWDRYSSIEHN